MACILGSITSCIIINKLHTDEDCPESKIEGRLSLIFYVIKIINVMKYINGVIFISGFSSKILPINYFHKEDE